MIGRAAAVLVVAVLGAACASGAPGRPVGAAVDDPTAVTTLAAATTHCRPLRTATADFRLTGRVGATRVRAQLVAGFAAPAAIRVEAMAPFGGPALVVASDGDDATVWFPREREVVRGASVADVMDALTGLALDGGELRRLLFGCLVADGGRGRAYGDAWQAVEDAGARVYLRRGAVVAADYRGWQIDYALPQAGVARRVRVRRTVAGGAIDLTATVGEIGMNVEIDPRAFTVDVPGDATALTLDDLRRAGPLTPP